MIIENLFLMSPKPMARFLEDSKNEHTIILKRVIMPHRIGKAIYVGLEPLSSFVEEIIPNPYHDGRVGGVNYHRNHC